MFRRSVLLFILSLWIWGCTSPSSDQGQEAEEIFLATGFVREHSFWLCGSEGVMLEHYDSWFHPRLANDFCPLVWVNPEDFLIGKYVGIHGYWLEDTLELCPRIVVKSAEEILIRYRCGDVNLDWVIDSTDAIFIFNYICMAGGQPSNLKAADPNCDGSINVSDIIYLLNYIYLSGPPPCDYERDGIPDCK